MPAAHGGQHFQPSAASQLNCRSAVVRSVDGGPGRKPGYSRDSSQQQGHVYVDSGADLGARRALAEGEAAQGRQSMVGTSGSLVPVPPPAGGVQEQSELAG